VEVLAFQVSAAECWTGVTPEPDNITVVGDPVALLTMEMLPFTLPATVGLNCAPSVRFWPGDSVTGVLPPVTVYPAPLAAICEIVTFALPVFVIVTFCEAEVVLVVTLPKLRLVGLILSVKVVAIPDPLSATEVGEVGALLTIVIPPVTAPTDTGANATVIVVFCPAFTVSGSGNPLTLKPGPVAVSWVMLSAAVPVFVMINTWDKLPPTTTFTKFMEVELT
jgi:hypothetical protein